METLRLGLRADTLKEILLATEPSGEGCPDPRVGRNGLEAVPRWPVDRPPRRRHRDGRRLADDAAPRPVLRLQAVDRDRHRHRPRGDLQVVRQSSTAASGTSTRASRRGRCSARRRSRSAGCRLAWWLTRAYGDGDEDTAKAILGVALVVCGIAYLVKAYLHRARRTSRSSSRTATARSQSATGVVGGFVVGLTSVGSGTLFGLVMLVAFPLTAAKIAARTSSTPRSSSPSRARGMWSPATSISPRPDGSSSARSRAC